MFGSTIVGWAQDEPKVKRLCLCLSFTVLYCNVFLIYILNLSTLLLVPFPHFCLNAVETAVL